MKILNILLFTILIMLEACSGGSDCSKLPNSFSSYEAALKSIKKSKFKINEDVNTARSSWIKGASYYTCDGIKGYLIIETKNKEYLYANLPIEIWNEFKNAKSFGSFYNAKIKDKFKLKLIN